MSVSNDVVVERELGEISQNVSVLAHQSFRTQSFVGACLVAAALNALFSGGILVVLLIHGGK